MSYRFRRPAQDDLPAVTELVARALARRRRRGRSHVVRRHAFPHCRPRARLVAGRGRGGTPGRVRLRAPAPSAPAADARRRSSRLPRRGIGTELRDRIEERAREQAQDAPEGEEVWLGADAGAGNDGAKRFFEQRGYELLRHFWEMGIELDEEPPEPAWPDGIRVEHARRGVDERAVHAASDEAFADHWEHHPTPVRGVAQVDGRIGQLRPVALAARLGRRRDRRALALRPRSGRGLGRRPRRAASVEAARAGHGAPVRRASARSATAASRGRSWAWTRPTRPARRSSTRASGCASSTSFSRTG